jgi:hypothetical protein
LIDDTSGEVMLILHMTKKDARRTAAKSGA